MANLYNTRRLSEKIKKVIYLLCVFVLNFFFFFFLGEKGTVWGKDTLSYIEWSYLPIRRGYVVYPWFLKVLRLVHGEEQYIRYAYIYQGFLSILIDILLIEYIKKKYKMGWFAGIVMHFLILATYSYTLPEAVSSHYLLTESISIPFFLLSMLFFLRYINGEGRISFLISCMVSMVLYYTRKQLIVVLFAYISIAFINELTARVAKKNIGICFWTSLCVIIVALVVCIFGYFIYISRWEYSEENNQLIEATTGKALCLMTEDDARLYIGQDREIYNELYLDCKMNGRLLANFPDSIMDYEKIHKIINENITEHETTIWGYFIRMQGDKGGRDSFAVRNRITATEISNHKVEYVGIILRLIPSSLVGSIFVQPFEWRIFCYIFSAFMYLFAVVTITYFIKLKRRKSCYLPMLTVLTIILCNSFFCNIVLYGQQRYVIYCMGLFYIFVLLMINDLWKNKNDI